MKKQISVKRKYRRKPEAQARMILKKVRKHEGIIQGYLIELDSLFSKIKNGGQNNAAKSK